MTQSTPPVPPTLTVSYASAPPRSYASVRGLTIATTIAFGALAFIDVVAVFSQLMQISFLNRAWRGDVTGAAANDFRQSAVALISTTCSWVTVVLFLVWMSRAHRNLPAILTRPVSLDYSPLSVVLWWFCPIISLYAPYAAMREIDRYSHPGGPKAVSAALPQLWWALFLFRNFNGLFVLFASLPGGSTREEIFARLYRVTWLALLGNCISIVAILPAVLIIWRITRHQQVAIDRRAAEPIPAAAGNDARQQALHALLQDLPAQSQ